MAPNAGLESGYPWLEPRIGSSTAAQQVVTVKRSAPTSAVARQGRSIPAMACRWN